VNCLVLNKFKKILLKNFRIILKDKKEICENTLAFYFDTTNSGFTFEAGQYAHFTINDPKFHDEKGDTRPFSIANSPHIKNEIVISARINSSVFINNLSHLSPGAEIHVSNPEGNFRFDNDLSLTSVFITGGIGITPVRSLIENEIYKSGNRKIFLFYSNKTESQTAFFDDFKNWSESFTNFKFIPLIEDLNNENWKYEFGNVTEIIMLKHLDNFFNKVYYMTGPQTMVKSVKNILLKNKVSPDNIQTEQFN